MIAFFAFLQTDQLTRTEETAHMQFLHDLDTGMAFKTETLTITANDIIEFASEYDPQPYHLDVDIAEKSIFGGLCASGWQVCALMMRLMVDTFEREGIASAGSSSVESLRWFIPVFTNDTLKASIEITGKSDTSQLPGHGIANCAVDVTNQHDKSVIKLQTSVLVKQSGHKQS